MGKIIWRRVMVVTIFAASSIGIVLTATSAAQLYVFQNQIEEFVPAPPIAETEKNIMLLQEEINSLRWLISLKDDLYTDALDTSLLFAGISFILFQLIFLALVYQFFFGKGRIMQK